jgi:hypothetical protein
LEHRLPPTRLKLAKPLTLQTVDVARPTVCETGSPRPPLESPIIINVSPKATLDNRSTPKVPQGGTLRVASRGQPGGRPGEASVGTPQGTPQWTPSGQPRGHHRRQYRGLCGGMFCGQSGGSYKDDLERQIMGGGRSKDAPTYVFGGAADGGPPKLCYYYMTPQIAEKTDHRSAPYTGACGAPGVSAGCPPGCPLMSPPQGSFGGFAGCPQGTPGRYRKVSFGDIGENTIKGCFVRNDDDNHLFTG